ncbi:sugar transferase, partial [Klebsiella pneumoniae]
TRVPALFWRWFQPRAMTRTCSIILGLFFTLLSLPAMLIVAIGIKLTSPGPVLFKQNRYGLNGKQIQVWKFRTMRVMVAAQGWRSALTARRSCP